MLGEPIGNRDEASVPPEDPVQEVLARFMDFAVDGTVFGWNWRNSLLAAVNPTSLNALRSDYLRAIVETDGMPGLKATLLKRMVDVNPFLMSSTTEEELQAYIGYDPLNSSAVEMRSDKTTNQTPGDASQL